METQNHTEREQQRRAWSEHILRGVEKKIPQVEFYIDDDGNPNLNTRTHDELKVQLTPGFQLHEWVYEQLVSYTVRCDLYYRYRLEML